MTTRDEQIQRLFLRSAIAARDAARDERDEARSDYRLLVERVKAVMPYAINTASWVTLLATIGVEPEDMHFSK